MYLCRFNRSIAAYATMPRRKRRVEKRDSGFHSEVSSLHISHLEALLTCILTCNWKSTQTPINIYQGYIYMHVHTLYIYMSCTLYSFTFQRSDSTSHDKEQHSASPEGICMVKNEITHSIYIYIVTIFLWCTCIVHILYCFYESLGWNITCTLYSYEPYNAGHTCTFVNYYQARAVTPAVAMAVHFFCRTMERC